MGAPTPSPDPAGIPVDSLPGIGPRIAARLAGLGIHSVEDLLFHLPVRYQDRTRVVEIGSLRAGREALVAGELEGLRVAYGRRRSLVAAVRDATGAITVRWFHFSEGQRRALARTRRLWCFGVPRAAPGGLELVHPEHGALEPEEPVPVADTLTPVYPAGEGVGQGTLRRAAAAAAARAAAERVLPREHLPAALRRRFGLPPLGAALLAAHRPPPAEGVGSGEAALDRARRRLALDELLAHHLALRLRASDLDRARAPAIPPAGSLTRALLARLPFALTAAQRRALDEIGADLSRDRPMHRLLQGDVGSGKTVVAALAALRVVEAGHQVALMAPTELLCEQHHARLAAWLRPLGVAVRLLTGGIGAAARRETLRAIGEGEPGIVVGTHALVEAPAALARPGLAVVDEQHRFGVHQRLALRRGSADAPAGIPHLLVMTATPIPRTLAMVAYADLDTSVIDALPPGRHPVETAAVSVRRRAEVVARVARACRAGEQAYWICPLVETSEAIAAAAAVETARRLGAELPDLRVGLVHGRMDAAEKARALAGFAAGHTRLLVATTVIEVGVDVPAATLMVIESAQRLGLAALHQLRGRVGRGSRPSACVLLYDPPLTPAARARLDVLRETGDGFRIARRDLELRGPGEMLGTRQAGEVGLRVADLVRDAALLPAVEALGAALLETAPRAARATVERWVGAAGRYAHA